MPDKDFETSYNLGSPLPPSKEHTQHMIIDGRHLVSDGEKVWEILHDCCVDGGKDDI